MYCKYCGKQIADDSMYCQYCGKKIDNPQEVSKPRFEVGKCYYWIVNEYRSHLTKIVDYDSHNKTFSLESICLCLGNLRIEEKDWSQLPPEDAVEIPVSIYDRSIRMMKWTVSDMIDQIDLSLQEVKFEPIVGKTYLANICENSFSFLKILDYDKRLDFVKYEDIYVNKKMTIISTDSRNSTPFSMSSWKFYPLEKELYNSLNTLRIDLNRTMHILVDSYKKN